MKAKRNSLLAIAGILGLCSLIFGTLIYKVEHPSPLNHEMHFHRPDTPGVPSEPLQ